MAGKEPTYEDLAQQVRTLAAESAGHRRRAQELEESFKRCSAYLEILLNFSRDLTRVIDLQALYRKITEFSRNLLGLDFSTLLMLAADGQTLIVRDTIGFPDRIVGTMSLLKGQGLSTLAVQEKKPVVVVDFSREQRFEVPPLVFEQRITSAISVPMMVGDEVFGVLTGHTHAERQFGHEEIALYQSLANQAAVAIKNVMHLKSLRESEERYRDLFENAFDLIQILSPAGRLLYVNRAWLKAFGYAATEIAELSVYQLIDPYCGERCREVFDEVISAGKRGRLENYFITKDGRRLILEGSATCKFKNGEPQYILCILRDVTEKKKMEEELHRAQKLESVGLLAGGIAHDFNNLLTSILGNVSLAKANLPPADELYRQLAATEKATLRAKDLTMQLLTFSKGGAPVRSTTFLADLITESTDFALQGSNIRRNYDLPADLWPAEVDRGQLGQVFHNLAINAAQAMPAGGTITVSAENVTIAEQDAPLIKTGRYVKISFSDQGPGIPASDLPRIFDPYFTTKEKGSGLGLSVAYSIIKNHDGRLTVASAAGSGATFVIHLPASAETAVAKEAAVDEIVTGSGRILVMDDDEIVRIVTKEMLNHLGYEAEFAADGAAALAAYGKARQEGRPFDAVIMDLTVPGGMGGKETIKELLKIDPAAKAIVASGYATDPVMAAFAQYGFKGVAPKPFSIQELSRVLKQIM